jgi:hypothetical protein
MRTFKALALVATLVACGGDVADDGQIELGTVGQAYSSKGISLGGGATLRLGVQQDTNNSACTSAIGANTVCRFLTMQQSSGSVHPTYLLATQTNFTSAERAIINPLLDQANIEMNSQTGYPAPGGPQPAGWSRQADGQPVAIQIFKADFTSDGTDAMRNFVQVQHTGCGGTDLVEGPAVNGKYRACTGATIGVDWDAITAKYTGPLPLFRARNQVLQHGLMSAMGWGTTGATGTYRSSVVVSGANPPARFSAGELCMVNQFVDVPFGFDESVPMYHAQGGC